MYLLKTRGPVRTIQGETVPTTTKLLANRASGFAVVGNGWSVHNSFPSRSAIKTHLDKAGEATVLRAAGLVGDVTVWEPMYRVLDARSVRKALDPNARRDFEVIVEREAKKLTKENDKVLGDFYDEAFKRLDSNWVDLPANHRDAVLRRVLADLDTGFPDKELGVAIAAVAAAGSKNVMKRGASTFTSAHDLNKLKWTAAENEFTTFLGESAGNYVTTIERQIHDGASIYSKAIVQRGLKEGLGSADIADELQDQLKGLTGRTNLNYYRGVSSTYVSRARSYSQAASMNQARIVEYEIVAILDAATCPRCRWLHGRTFSVGGALDIFKRLKAMKDPEDIKYIQPWPIITPLGKGLHELGIPTKGGVVPIAREVRAGMGLINDTGDWKTLPGGRDMEKLHFGPPLFHSLCRCTTKPVLKSTP